MIEPGGKRLLIVSDLHLGRDCNEITGFKRAARPAPDFDQAFVDLMDFYTSAREEEWRLIFAGDFIDFIEVVVAKSLSEGRRELGLSFDVTDEEREFGLGSEPERVLVKLERTMDYHVGFFRRLAHFIREGGEVCLLRGNHDVEFHWRKVQRVFRRRLADLAFEGAKFDVDQTLEQRASFQERLTILPWMYMEPGRVYIEHGHQYDVYCSFDHQLFPVSPTDSRRIDTPLAAFAMRYFVNMLTDFTAHDADLWGARDYVRWLRQKGPGGVFYTAKMAIGTGARMMIYAARFGFGTVRRYGQEHNRSLAEEASRFGVPVDKLQQIDSLRHTPVNRNLFELARLLFVDRLLLASGVLAICLFFLIVVSNPWFELLGITGTAALGWYLNRKMAPRRFFLPGPKQAQAVKKISELLGVPLVVMGHSHVRRVTDLGRGARYINTGCWLPPLSNLDHVDMDKPCTCKLSHLVIEDDDEADLRVFCKAAHTVRLADVHRTALMSPDTDDVPVSAA